jgi:hypothetical protein
MQSYLGMKPYLKGFHLLLETWRRGRDDKGWKVSTKEEREVKQEEKGKGDNNKISRGMKDMKIDLVTQAMKSDEDRRMGPPSGLAKAVPFNEDLEAILDLAASNQPAMRCVRSKCMPTAYYKFGNASSAGFRSTVECPSGINGRFSLWGRDKDDMSSNYRELRNLVEMVEEEASKGHLKDSELWLFTDNSMAKSCFFKGGLTSRLLHESILRLRKVEIQHGFACVWFMWLARV